MTAAGDDDGRQTVEGAVVSALSPVTHSLRSTLDSRLIFAEKDDEAATPHERARAGGQLDGRRRSMYETASAVCGGVELPS